MTDDSLQVDDLEERQRVRVEWSPRGGRGTPDTAEGEVTRVWRPDGEVEEFTVQADGFAVNVYTEYRNPVVERVESEDGDEAETETVGRLEGVERADGA